MTAPPHTSVPRLSLVLLAGGKSSRMGKAKHLMTYPDGTLVYQSRLKMLSEEFPEAQNICLILGDNSKDHVRTPPEMNVQTLIVGATSPEAHLNGPAAGLHAAFRCDPASHWLVIPCDYPLLTGNELKRLCEHYQDPVTCFENSRGSTESLVAIWSPSALDRVKTDVIEDKAGLSNLIAQLGGTRISPQYDHSLFNTNTQEDWDDAMQLLKELHHPAESST